MTKNEGVGLAVAAIGHVALFLILSVVWSAKPTPLPTPKPIDVSLVDAIALDQRAPPAPEPPAQSTAPDQGPPEDAPPPAKAPEQAADPAPPKPQPEAVPPPKPAPKPLPPVKQPVAEKVEKPAKAKPAPVKAAAPPAKAVAATKAAGSNPKATKSKATGSLLDAEFRKGLSQTPSKAKSPVAAPGATMDAKAAADIGSAIRRQVQPCADRQVNPGPGASRIVVTIALSLNRDGSLAARPSVAADHGGVDDENRRYVDAVDRNAIAAFSGCAPLRGLPPELYDVPRGWKTFKLRYKLPG